MPWPSDDDYRTMVQQPRMVFSDPELQACTVGTYPNGRPKGSSGNFALVYRMLNGSWSRAVRFFKQPPRPDQEERYLMLDRAINKAKARGLIEFSYDPEGIRWGKAKYPLLTMRWVEGQTLGLWLKEAVLRNDASAIGKMADAWVELITDLRSNDIAHGDLQHGNVMVESGRPVLVDYDCMFVPEMTTVAQRTPTEFGLPGYQHPGRPKQLLSAELDNFSAWVILIALRAIADDLDLWRRYVEARDTENLLLTLSDLEQPNSAPIWDDLTQRAKSREVREWARSLRESISRPFEDIPPFGLNLWEELETEVAKKDWRAIRDMATGAKYASRTFPPHLAPVVEEAFRRVESLGALGTKARSKRAREIATAYRPDLLDDWAEAATLVALGKKAKAAVGLIEDLDRAEAGDRTGRSLLSLWKGRGKELDDFVEAADYQTRSDAWEKRIAAADRVAAAVKRGTPEKGIADAWEALSALGGHPDADAHRNRAAQAARRVTALASLAGISKAQDEATDAALLQAWDQVATLLDGCPEADAIRDQAGAARGRAQLLARLLRAIEQADRRLGSEEAVVDAASALPPGYGAAQAVRVGTARHRIASTKALSQALAARPQSDVAIAEAADRAEADGNLPADPSELDRCALARRRRDLLRALDALPPELPVDEKDAKWLEIWDTSLLGPCHDARPYAARRDEAARRTEMFAALEQALAAGTAVEVKRLAQAPVLAGHPGLVRRGAEIDSLIATSEKVERLVAAAQRGAAAAFLEEVEPGLIAVNAATFLPHRDRIKAWIGARLAQGDVLRPAHPTFLPDPSGHAVTARWTWAQHRLVRTCLVAADAARFLDRPEDARHGTQRLDPDSYRRTKGGTSLSLLPGSYKLYVTVWPVVDLGWDRLTGPPLKLGPFDAAVRGNQLARGSATSRVRSRSWFQRIRDWLFALLNG